MRQLFIEKFRSPFGVAIASISLIVLSTTPALAQAGSPPSITITPLIGFTSLSQAINTLVTALIFFGALMTLIFIIIGAIRYVSAGDDASAVKQARATMTNAVIGLVVLGLIFVIFKFATNLIPGLGGVFTLQ